MPTFTVTEAGVTKTGLGTSGDMQEITLNFADGSSATWFCKQGTPVPGPGPIEGIVEPSTYGPKFKKARPAGSSGGGQKMDPDREAKIIRQPAQKAAVEALKHPAFAAMDVPEVKKTLTSLINFFANDTANTGKVAAPTPQSLDDAVAKPEPAENYGF